MQVFVVGHPGSGKTTLVEALKFCKGWKYFLARRVSECDIDRHTAGIIPSKLTFSGVSNSVLFYDLAGDPENYSSNAATTGVFSGPGCNAFLLVVDLSRDQNDLSQQLGHWVRFISSNTKHSSSRSIVLTIGSHANVMRDRGQDPTPILDYITSFTTYHCNQLSGNLTEVQAAIELDCRSVYSTCMLKVRQQLEELTSRNLPKKLSPGAVILSDLLNKCFKPNRSTCRMVTLLDHIRASEVQLPKNVHELNEIVQELHEIGELVNIRSEDGDPHNQWLILEVAKITQDIHEKLVSKTTCQSLSWKFPDSINLQRYLQFRIIPELLLEDILPQHISKECLIHLQYCQEFHRTDVMPDHFNTDSEAVSPGSTFLFFPALLQLERSSVTWSAPGDLTCCRGCYIQCSGDFDCFPLRFINVVLLRLAFQFAMPNPSHQSVTGEAQVQLQARHCTKVDGTVNLHGYHCKMWRYGIHWLTEEGVECLVEITNGAKGVLVVTRSEVQFQHECKGVFLGLVKQVMGAKAELCQSFGTEHFLISPDSDGLKRSSLPDIELLHLFKVSDVQKVVRRIQNIAISTTSRKSLNYTQAQHIWIDNIWSKFYNIPPHVAKYL